MKGKFGNVYYAKECMSGREVALKVLYKSALQNSKTAFIHLQR